MKKPFLSTFLLISSLASTMQMKSTARDSHALPKTVSEILNLPADRNCPTITLVINNTSEEKRTQKKKTLLSSKNFIVGTVLFTGSVAAYTYLQNSNFFSLKKLLQSVKSNTKDLKNDANSFLQSTKDIANRVATHGTSLEMAKTEAKMIALFSSQQTLNLMVTNANMKLLFEKYNNIKILLDNFNTDCFRITKTMSNNFDTCNRKAVDLKNKKKQSNEELEKIKIKLKVIKAKSLLLTKKSSPNNKVIENKSSEKKDSKPKKNKTTNKLLDQKKSPKGSFYFSYGIPDTNDFINTHIPQKKFKMTAITYDSKE